MRVIIHIGVGKTGTTTIQSFLAKNREKLMEQGVFVPPTVYPSLVGNHIELAAATYSSARCGGNMVWFAPMFKKGFTIEDQNKLWQKIRREIETICNKSDLVIFSCEAFDAFTEPEVERVRELMSTLFDEISVIMYVRRQPEYLISIYNTYVCTVCETQNFMNFSRPLRMYHEIAKDWSTIFGRDKINIRIFDKREFYGNDLLSDFARTVGFDMSGLEYVENQNETMGSAEIEYLRLLNFHVVSGFTSDMSLPNSVLSYSQQNREKSKKSHYLTRDEARQILDRYREGNDWIAREFFSRKKLFSDDLSMYPEEVESPHGLTLEKCAEITAHLWKERCGVIQQLQAENQRLETEKNATAAEKQNRDTEIQRLWGEIHHRDAEIQRQQAELQRSHDNLALLQQKHSIYWHYYRCKMLAKITFGKKRKHYKEKRNAFHEKVRLIRAIYKQKK